MSRHMVSQTFQRQAGRAAAIYVRQSSLEQVENNKGSREYQMALRGVAADEFGYPEDLIRIYEDAGLTGSAAEHRPGYQRLLREIRSGEIDLLVASDPSRLSRDTAEWLSLMFLCRIHGVRLVLDRKLVDPTQGDERFMIGIQAIFAEHDNWRRSESSRRGRLAKLGQGKAVTPPPAGYVWGSDGSWLKDDRPLVRESIEAHYRALREGRSLIRAVALLKKWGVESPARRPKHGLGWSRPTVSTVARFVHHPAYVGDATYGRLRADPTRPRDGRGHFRLQRAPEDEIVVIRDHHEPYITRDEQQAFKALLRRNAFAGPHGVLGAGQAKGQGVARCGKHRQLKMAAVVKKTGQNGDVRFVYVCPGGVAEAEKGCAPIPGWVIDEPLFGAVLDRLRPQAVDSLAAVLAQAEADALSEGRRRRETVHRLRRDIEDLEEACDRTDNALWTVKKRYQERLHEKNLLLRRLERSTGQPSARNTISDAEIAALRDLCLNLEALLTAPTTEPRDRKELVRIMVDRVVVEERTRERVKLRIVWNDDEADTNREVLLFPFAHRMTAEWARQGVSPEEIAVRLNALGIRTKYRTLWTAKNVSRQLARLGQK